jgi:hypothetical protein
VKTFYLHSLLRQLEKVLSMMILLTHFRKFRGMCFLTILLIINTPTKSFSTYEPQTSPPPPFALPTQGYLGVCWDDPKFKSGGNTNHAGIDVWSDKDDDSGNNKPGKPVYAVYDGEVEQTDDRRITLKLDTLPMEYEGILPQREGLRGYYTHLEEIYVTAAESGQSPHRVQKGDLIGRQGNKGTTMVHLHFSLKKGTGSEDYIENTLDPSPYLGMKLASPDCGVSTNMWMSEFVRDAVPSARRLDLAILIDSTSSMWDDIAAAKASSTRIINSIPSSVDLQIAIVDFRDFPISPYGSLNDYPYRDVLPFTSDRNSAIEAINRINIGTGGDPPEASYCALMHTMTDDRCNGRGSNSSLGKWRSTSTKAVVWITDAPPHDPEPFTGFTSTSVIKAAKDFVVVDVGGSDGIGSGPPPGTDPIIVEAVPIGGNPSTVAAVTEIARQTGGGVFPAANADEVVDAILEAIDRVLFSKVYLPLVQRSGNDLILPTRTPIGPTATPPTTSTPIVATSTSTLTPLPESTPTNTATTIPSPTPTNTPVPNTGCIISAGAWQNSAIAAQTGTFTAAFDATPNAASMDGVIGFSAGAANDYANLAAIARFSPQGFIDARNGSAYQANSQIPYTPGVSYRFRLEIDIPNHVYSVFVTPAGGSEQLVANNFAFRTEQSAVGSLNNLALYAKSGSHQVCNVAITTRTSPPPSTCTTSSSSWQNTPIAAQSGSFTAAFDATPNNATMDGVMGLSASPATGYASLAAIARFSPTGIIDARNGGAYQADTQLAYTPGATYHFRLVIRIPSHTYDIFVTPPGGAEQLVGSNFAFRTEQSSVGNLTNWALYANTGSHTVCNLTISP